MADRATARAIDASTPTKPKHDAVGRQGQALFEMANHWDGAIEYTEDAIAALQPIDPVAE